MPVLTELMVDATCSACGKEMAAGTWVLQDSTVRHMHHER